MMKKRRDTTRETEGVISISGKGMGYVKTPERDIEIAPLDMHTALHGDRVAVRNGEVIRIISRAKPGFAGVLEEENGLYYLRPDDPKMYTDIIIPWKSLSGAKPGDKIFATITSWKTEERPPLGQVEKVLGKPGQNEAEMEAISLEKGFALRLPEKVEAEAKTIKKRGIKEEDYAGRKDFRDTLTITIDPIDAKDFDDAISFREIGKEYEIGIHIADVSHYVNPGSEIDKEARKRGTSVYLVDRTIPMLPEALSNDLCSLVPNADRLAMSAIFILDKNGNVKREWYGRTVIRSAKRFTYEEAEKTIHSKEMPFHRELSILNKIAKALTKERFAHGAVSLDQEEVKFILNEEGVPIKVIKKERGDSNKLIEEFMLLANRKVAEKISGKKEGIFVYRVHDKPSVEKMADLASFLTSIGYKVKLKNGVIPSKEINTILEELEGKEEKDAVHKAVIRSMAKAVYSTENIGHYGLAFRHYTHFTSPIRRYPDVIVHRLLSLDIKGKKIGKDHLKEYEAISRSSSEREKYASDAERASIRYKQAEYMSKRIGRKFDGIISGVQEWGIYVEEKETKCEGLIRIREFAGGRRRKKYRLGDKVRIRVKSVDLERKTIDYELA